MQERRGGVEKARERERDCLTSERERDGGCVKRRGIHWEAMQERGGVERDLSLV